MPIDLTKSAEVASYKHHSPLVSCAFDPTSRFVLAGGRDRALLCLDVVAKSTIELSRHKTWVGNIVRCGTDLILTADFAGTIIAWDCTGDKPQQRWEIAGHACTIYALTASPDGKLFATGDRDGNIRIWRASDGKRLHELLAGHPVYGLAFHPDGRRLISADRQPKEPRLKVWVFATGKEQRSIDVPQLSAYRRVEDIEWGGIRGITLSPDGGTLVACGSLDYSGPACALLFDVETGELKRKLTSTLKGFYYSALFHAQGVLLTAGGDISKGEVRTWDPAKEESIAATSTPGPCTGLDIQSDGRLCVVTQMLGQRSYPDSGSLTLFEWSE